MVVLPEHHDLSNLTEGSLATTSASSLRSLGCISASPIDLCQSSFNRWSWTSSLLTGGALHSSTGGFRDLRDVGSLPMTTEVKNLFGASDFYTSVTTSFSFLFVGVHFSWPSFSDQSTESSFFISFIYFWLLFIFCLIKDRFGLVVQTLMLNSSLQGSEISTTFGIWKSLHCIQIYLLGDHL